MLLALLLLSFDPAAPGQARPPSCNPARLALSTDGENGAFNGMSHSGTLVAIRNRGTRTCTVDALPVIRFRDARGRVLPAERKAPARMHPGPVMVPVAVPPGKQAGTPLRWVSGPVYDHSRCVDARAVAVQVNGGMLQAPVAAHLCGPATGPIAFEQPAVNVGQR